MFKQAFIVGIVAFAILGNIILTQMSFRFMSSPSDIQVAIGTTSLIALVVVDIVFLNIVWRMVKSMLPPKNAK